VTIESYATNFNPLVPPDEAIEVSKFMLEKCPVAHSNMDNGFWIVNDYKDLFTVLRETTVFPSSPALIPTSAAVRPVMIPLDVNPPIHRLYRKLMDPYLSPKAMPRYADGVRTTVRGLIDAFIADGQCDLAEQLAKPFPALTTYEQLFGITDPDELRKGRFWVLKFVWELYTEDPETLAGYVKSWQEWMVEFIDERRRSPRKEDIIDGLIYGTVNERPLDMDELIGAITLLTVGGLVTTSDATCNIVIALASNPGMEQHLREDPALITRFIEEVLRLEPPVTALPRVTAADGELSTCVIPAGERVLMNFVAANRDPGEFEDPDSFRLDRPWNRHLSFGGGPHRCIGSNFARQSLRIAVEEMLATMRNIRFSSENAVDRLSTGSAGWRSVDHLRIAFDPIEDPSPVRVPAAPTANT
jgi:cytochrome P450